MLVALKGWPYGLMAVVFLLAMGLVPLLRPLAHAVGLLDRPGRRKQHLGVMPLTGGLSIAVAWLFGLYWLEHSLAPYVSLVAGMALMLFVGVVDDRFGLPAGIKLLTQALAAGMMVVWGGLMVTSLGSTGLSLGPWAAPFTVLCVVIMINAINMADGLDGLAGGLVAVAMIMLATVAALGGAEPPLLAIIGILWAAVLGFLAFNLRHPFLRRAKVFLGDSGSLMLGFAVAWLAVYVSQVPMTVSVYPVTIASILLLPVVDVLALIIIRAREGRNPMSPDRRHLHHRLLLAGLRHNVSVWALLLGMTVLGTIGIVWWQMAWSEWWLAMVLIIYALVQMTYTMWQPSTSRGHADSSMTDQ